MLSVFVSKGDATVQKHCNQKVKCVILLLVN